MKGSFGGFLVKGLTESATGKNYTHEGVMLKDRKRCKDAIMKETGTSPYENSRTMYGGKRIEGAPAWGKKEKRREVVVAGKGII